MIGEGREGGKPARCSNRLPNFNRASAFRLAALANESRVQTRRKKRSALARVLKYAINARLVRRLSRVRLPRGTGLLPEERFSREDKHRTSTDRSRVASTPATQTRLPTAAPGFRLAVSIWPSFPFAAPTTTMTFIVAMRHRRGSPITRSGCILTRRRRLIVLVQRSDSPPAVIDPGRSLGIARSPSRN